ncbi:MAG: PIN domain-containing protein [Candidatus Latescibacteria bacterium]|nr:PIN domain-containing protein [Candidatus Latescibacterota bacterium]
MSYLLDTDICIYIINRRPAEVIRKFKQLDVGEIGLSAISVSELRYGVAKSEKRPQNTQRLEEFLAPFEILPYDETVASTYGEIRAELERRGEPIGSLDLFIAAHALSRELTLVTNNEREFRRVGGLRVENWQKAK